MPDNQIAIELANRLSGKVIVSADISDSDLTGMDLEALTGSILSFFNSAEGMKLLDKDQLGKIKERMAIKKEPVTVEIIKETSFKPLAKEMDGEYSFKNFDVEMAGVAVNDFAAYFNDRLNKIRNIIEASRSANFGGMIKSIESVKQYAAGREVGVIGMVYDRIITKNGHVMITLEDETGSAKVLFLRPDKNSRPEFAQLFSSSEKIVVDEVLAIKGKLSGPFIIANAILWPDVPIKTRKQIDEDIAIAFTSDIHVGSKLFLEKQFNKFLQWINGDVDYRQDLAGKIKYIVASGDLVDGIGVYPNQDKELSIPDIYKQYSVLFDLLSKIPDYIHVFLLTGNHDAVRLAEPQPALTDELIGDFKQSNIHFLSNPARMTLHGLKIIGNHGTTLDSIIQSIPGCSYSRPEGAMIEVLKRRHISPIYGDNPIVPGKRDPMVIDEVPDVLHMGHVHKNGYADYHGTLIVNGGTWQGRTGYQIKLGHVPTPALLPVYEAKSMQLSSVDFNDMGA